MRAVRPLIVLCALVGLLVPTVASAAPSAPGGISTRIIGGSDAPSGGWPAFARLLVQESDGTYLCGGTLIQPTVVLTAAHCVSGAIAAQSTVAIGVVNKNDGPLIPWSSYVANPHYNATTYTNDVALVRLASPSPATPMAIISPDQDAQIVDGLNFDVAGFGTISKTADYNMPATLQQVTIPFVPDATCADLYEKFASSSMLCAGLQAPVRDSCSGDSGGPLAFVPAGATRRVLAGNVSWGVFPCNGTAPGVYGRISAFRPWLATALANPRITGVTNAGATVTVSWAHDDPTAAWAPVTFAFVRDGTSTPVDSSASSTAFTVASNAPVTVQVQALSGAEQTTGTWSGTPTAARAPVVAAGITGRAWVGELLHATATVDDPWATLTYRWLVDGTVVPTATSATYRPTREDMGKAITVSVAATHDTFVGSATATTARIAGLPRPSTRTVAVRGTVAVGGRVWVRAPLASGYPKPRVRYQWLRNRRPLPRTTRASYVITPADAGRRLACRITYTTHAGSTVIVSRTIRVP